MCGYIEMHTSIYASRCIVDIVFWLYAYIDFHKKSMSSYLGVVGAGVVGAGVVGLGVVGEGVVGLGVVGAGVVGAGVVGAGVVGAGVTGVGGCVTGPVPESK